MGEVETTESTVCPQYECKSDKTDDEWDHFYITSDEGFAIVRRCARRLPVSEIAYFVRATGETVYHSMYWVAYLRLMNKICSTCHRDAVPVFACPRCEMTWYCSPQCQAQDKERHDAWCCNPEAEQDMGIMKTRLIMRCDVERTERSMQQRSQT